MPSPASTTARGYGAEHQAEKRRWQRILDAEGSVPCDRCGEPVFADEEWDLGHTDDRTAWTGPEHTYCNRAAGGRARRAHQMTVRAWGPAHQHPDDTQADPVDNPPTRTGKNLSYPQAGMTPQRSYTPRLA